MDRRGELVGRLWSAGGDRALTPGVVTPNPANPPVDILYEELASSTNLLGGVHILTGKRHPVNDVPYKTEGKWDPGLTRIGDRWYLSYVIATDLFTDFQPALARSASGADHTALQFVGADWGKRATEGPIIQKLGASGVYSPPVATTSRRSSATSIRCARSRWHSMAT